MPHSEYDKICRPSPNQWLEKHALKDDELCQMKQLVINSLPTNEKPPIPETLSYWLQSKRFNVENSVYETKEWIDCVKNLVIQVSLGLSNCLKFLICLRI